MEERINELLALIDTQLATQTGDMVTESYKAKNLASYTQALRNLLDINKTMARNGEYKA